MNKPSILLTLMFLLSGLSGFAQNEYLPGYVVLNNGDTLRGSLRDRDLDRGVLYRRIRFRNEDGKKQKYDAYDLKGYRIEQANFESLWYAEQSVLLNFSYFNRYGVGNKVFLRVEYKGSLSCYTREWIDGDNSTLESFPLFLKEGDDRFQRVSQGLFGLKKKQLAEYFQDCPDLVEQIQSDQLHDPVKIAEYYNQYCL